MEFRILGPLEVRDGECVLPLGGPKRRAVIARLLLDANRVVPAERLIAAVWGEEMPDTARAALHNHLARVRTVLGTRLETRPGGYVLHVEPDELDLERFNRLVGDARMAAPEARASRLRDALSLWRGPPLDDLADEPVATAAAHLEELFAKVLEDRVEADLALGRHAELVSELEGLVEEHPFRERLREQLILALYRSGRQAEALEAYGAARRILVENLGIEPRASLRALQRAVLRQDAELGLVSASPVQPVAGVGSRESRRIVTVLLADLVGDVPVGHDAEARREAARDRFEASQRPVELHGGTAERYGADRMIAVFGAPAVHEDDALRAVRAAFEIVPLIPGGHVVLATGEAVAGGRASGEPLVAGSVVNEAEHLHSDGTGAGVLADERTWRLVQHAVVARQYDGAHLLEHVAPFAPPLLRRLETPLVGRQHELAEAVWAFDRAVRDGTPELVTVLGVAGIGKTRLALELTAVLGERATSVVGHCRSYGENGTYAPLADAVLALGGQEVGPWLTTTMRGEPDGERIATCVAAAVGAGREPGSVDEIAWGTRRLLETLARRRPLVFVVEDAHWAAPAFLDLLDLVVDLARAPILVLAVARPELLESRPGWGGGTASRSSIALEQLSDAEAKVLLERLAPPGALDPASRQRVLALAEGNPLFLEQLLAAAVEGGPLTVPDSIHTLLEARLDRLPEQERDTLEIAAVCGTRFSTTAVADVLGRDPRPLLLALARRELVRPDEDDAWAFRHVLIRDEAYRAIPKRRRAVLHEGFAGTVDRLRPPGISDLDLLIGRHLATAARCRRDVGEAGAAIRRLAQQAGERLRAAGLRAFERSEAAVAASLLTEAVELLPRTSRKRVEPLLKLAEALALTGDQDRKWGALEEARRLANQLGDERLCALAAVTRCDLEFSTERPRSRAERLRDLDEAIAVLERAGDDEGLAHAHILRALSLPSAPRTVGWAAERDDAISESLRYARRARSRRLEHYALNVVLMALRRGSVPVDEAKRRVHEVLAAPPARATCAPALTTLGILCAMEGEHREARQHAEEARQIHHELGATWQEVRQATRRAEVEMIGGEPAAAEPLLRTAYEQSIEFADPELRANAAWQLALVLTELGRDDEAEPLTRVAATIGSEGGFWTDVWWRLVLAGINARRGKPDEAEQLVAEALALTDEVRESGMHADAFLAAGTTLRLCGRDGEAAPLLERAAAIAERLGYLVAVRRARELLAATGP